MSDYPSQSPSAASAIRRFVSSDDALAITEYAMLVAFICIIIVGVLSIFGSQIGSWFAGKTGNITTV